MSSIITFTGKGGMKNVLQAPKEDIPTHQLKKEESKQGDTSSFVKQVDKKVITSTRSASIVLRYIPKSQRKHGELPISERLIPKSTTWLTTRATKSIGPSLEKKACFQFIRYTIAI